MAPFPAVRSALPETDVPRGQRGRAPMSPSGPVASWRHLAVPAALTIALAVGLVLRLRDLGDRSLWIDELFSVGLAAQSPQTMLTVLYGEEANMALYLRVHVRLGPCSGRL